MKIIHITQSKKKDKRFKVYLDNGDEYDFGSDGEAYIDHKDLKKRTNYWLRHLGNKREKELIDNFIASPALFSAYLLWNGSNLRDNIEWLNSKL